MHRHLSASVSVLVAWCLLGLMSTASRAADPSAKPHDGKVYIISNVHSGKRLAIEGGSKELNGKLVQDDATKTHVTWRLEKMGEGHFRIVNTSSDLSLDVPAESKEAGVQIEQWMTKTDPGTTSNQEWEFIRRGDHYAIRSRDSQLVLAVDNRSKESGAAVKQLALHDRDDNSQLWILTEVRK
jgi:hypothetical protein